MYLASISVLCSVFIAASAFEILSNHQLDPEVDMNVTEIIRYHGYPAEEYTVQTEDGYLLYIQRIPAGRVEDSCDIHGCPPKEVVFLQHGLLCSASNWITNLPNESFAFLLADAGFDVWMGNVRGNTYGLRHIKYKTNSNKFWDFSWDEMVKYDLPAMLKFVTAKTSQSSVYYVGHSQGTAIGFAGFSRNEEMAKMVKTFFALAPVTTVAYAKGPLKLLAQNPIEISMVHIMLGERDFLSSTPMIRRLGKEFCSNDIYKQVCVDLLFLLCGFDYDGLNQTRLPVYYTHTPAGTSVKNMIHWFQMVDSKTFQMYDYGYLGNKIHYGQFKAPLYDPEEMKVPVALYYGENDWLADPKDVKNLIPKLQNLIHSVEISKWNHLDFIWGMDAATLVYKEIIGYIKNKTFN